MPRYFGLRTVKEKTQARKLACEMERGIRKAILAGEMLQELYSRAHDFGTANCFAHYRSELEEILTSDDDMAGLAPFVKIVIRELDGR